MNKLQLSASILCALFLASCQAQLSSESSDQQDAGEADVSTEEADASSTEVDASSTPQDGGTPQDGDASTTPRSELAIESLYLHEAGQDVAHAEIQDGQDIEVGSGEYGIVVEGGAQLASVSMRLLGPISYATVDNSAPWSLYGDDEGLPRGTTLPPGEYSFEVQGFSQPDSSGIAGESRIINFTILHESDSNQPPEGGAAEQWILDNFSDVSELTGDITSRTTVDAPKLVKDVTACCGKYAFDVKDNSSPTDGRVAFLNVAVKDLDTSDAWGAAIRTADGVDLFIKNMTVDPAWPVWQGYSVTNQDGMDLDGNGSVYAEDLTVTDWNSDAGVDVKASQAQFVRLTISGSGHRTLRIWSSGPHYLVDSHLSNTGNYGRGSLLWFRNCDPSAPLYVYNSTFNGAATVPDDKIECDEGSTPAIVYLDEDPRTTGDLHPMFGTQ